MDILVAATKDWNITYNNEKMPCTPENVRTIYVSCPPIRKQVDEWMADEANFSKAS